MKCGNTPGSVVQVGVVLITKCTACFGSDTLCAEELRAVQADLAAEGREVGAGSSSWPWVPYVQVGQEAAFRQGKVFSFPHESSLLCKNQVCLQLF